MTPPPQLTLMFRSPDGIEISGRDWLSIWGYVEPGRDERVYQRLIVAARQQPLTSVDFELMAKWKDGAWTDGKFQPHVGRVAYHTWKAIIADPPHCPGQDEIDRFLNKWSETLCLYTYGDGTAKKRFGLPRATTLLHFLSAGAYPILDSWVMKALNGFKSQPGLLPRTIKVTDEVRSYLETFCPVFKKLEHACETDDTHRLDHALMRYAGFLQERETSLY
jgi:hypothetical protein